VFSFYSKDATFSINKKERQPNHWTNPAQKRQTIKIIKFTTLLQNSAKLYFEKTKIKSPGWSFQQQVKHIVHHPINERETESICREKGP